MGNIGLRVKPSLENSGLWDSVPGIGPVYLQSLLESSGLVTAGLKEMQNDNKEKQNDHKET